MAFAPPAVQSVEGAPEAGCARGRPLTGRAPKTHPSEFPKPPLGCVSGQSRRRSGGRKPRRERNFLSFSGPVVLGNFLNAASQRLDSAKFSGPATPLRFYFILWVKALHPQNVVAIGWVCSIFRNSTPWPPKMLIGGLGLSQRHTAFRIGGWLSLLTLILQEERNGQVGNLPGPSWRVALAANRPKRKNRWRRDRRIQESF